MHPGQVSNSQDDPDLPFEPNDVATLEKQVRPSASHQYHGKVCMEAKLAPVTHSSVNLTSYTGHQLDRRGWCHNCRTGSCPWQSP